MLPFPPPPPSPPAIIWQQIAELSLQDNNLTSDIRVGENSIDLVEKKKAPSSYPSKEKTLENLEKDLAVYFSQTLQNLLQEGLDQNISEQTETLLNEAQESLDRITKKLEANFIDPAVSISQAIQEAERDMTKAFYFLRKKFASPQQAPQWIKMKTGGWCVIEPAPYPTTMILSGGGMKGVGYVGAYKAMDESGILQDLSLIAGSSAGAMMASLIAAGMNAFALQETLDRTDYLQVLIGRSKDHLLSNHDFDHKNGFFQGTYAITLINQAMIQSIKSFFESISSEALEEQTSCLKIENILTEEEILSLFQLRDALLNTDPDNTLDSHTRSLINTRLLSKLADANEVQGVDGAQELSVYNILDAPSTGATPQFAASVEFRKKSITFQDLALLHKINPSHFKELIVTGFDKTKKQEKYFNAENTPLMPVAEAVRISMSLPGVFQPIKDVQGDLIEDGGVGSNTPSEVSTNPETTIVCAFDDKGTFYNIINREPSPSRFSLKKWFEISVESALSGNKNFEKDINQDHQKIYAAGPNALDIYHGKLSTISFLASSASIHAAQLQAETRMWEQLILRQNQATYHNF